MHARETPPESPTKSSYQPTFFLEVTKDLIDKLQLLVPSQTVVEGSSEVQITEVPASGPEVARPQASRVEYKSINEVYVLLSD